MYGDLASDTCQPSDTGDAVVHRGPITESARLIPVSLVKCAVELLAFAAGVDPETVSRIDIDSSDHTCTVETIVEDRSRGALYTRTAVVLPIRW